MKQLSTATSPNIPAAKEIRKAVDKQVWRGARNAMHKQVAAELDTREANGLFEYNLEPWADAMMEGQFSAGAMAQLDALNLVDGLDLEPFKGLQRIAQNTCWWWAFDVGAVYCEWPAKVSVNGSRVTMEFPDGWRVG